MEYSKEPFDFKLFIWKMIGKWHQLAAMIVAGSLLFGSSYYLYKVVYAPAREYQAGATYYIEYTEDPWLTPQGAYFNIGTLNSWLMMDVFTDQVLESLDESLTVEELDRYVEMLMPSDVKVVSLKVMTSDPVLTMQLLQAYDKAFMDFGERQQEIRSISVQDMDREAYQIKGDIRTQRAFVLGGVLGLVFGGLYLVLRYMLDDGIYLPDTLRKRHGLTVFGTADSEELAENIAYAVSNCKKVGLTAVGDAPELTAVLQKVKSYAGETEWVMIPAMVQCPQAAEHVRAFDGVVLVVVAGFDKSAAIDRALAFYRQQDIKVLGSVLWDADEKLLKRYGYMA